MLNASRQVGGVLGVALLGSLVSQHRTFFPGMHTALAIAGGVFLLGGLLVFLFVRRDSHSKSLKSQEEKAEPAEAEA